MKTGADAAVGAVPEQGVTVRALRPGAGGGWPGARFVISSRAIRSSSIGIVPLQVCRALAQGQPLVISAPSGNASTNPRERAEHTTMPPLRHGVHRLPDSAVRSAGAPAAEPVGQRAGRPRRATRPPPRRRPAPPTTTFAQFGRDVGVRVVSVSAPVCRSAIRSRSGYRSITITRAAPRARRLRGQLTHRPRAPDRHHVAGAHRTQLGAEPPGRRRVRGETARSSSTGSGTVNAPTSAYGTRTYSAWLPAKPPAARGWP